MRINLKKTWSRLLQILRLRSLSLAVKCQLMFGLAVVFTLALALILPLIWMRQLVKTNYLDTERAKVETLLLRQHFQLKAVTGESLVPLDRNGLALDPNWAAPGAAQAGNSQIQWIRFAGEAVQTRTEQGRSGQKQPLQLTARQQIAIDSLKEEERRLS